MSSRGGRAALAAALATVTLASYHSGGASGYTSVSVRRFDAGPGAVRTNVATTASATRYLVWGGQMTIAPFHDVRVGNALDLTTGKWTAVRPLGSRPLGRMVPFRHTLVLLPGQDARGLAHRGDILDLRTRAWQPLPPSPLDDATAVAGGEVDNKLLAFGNRDGHVITAVFDPEHQPWRVAAAPPQAPDDGASDAQYVSAVFGIGHEAVVLGLHTDTDGRHGIPLVYDLMNNRWRALSAVPSWARSLVAVVSTGRELLFWGESSVGDSVDLQAGRLVTIGARLDVATGRWSKTADVPHNKVADDDDRDKQSTPQAVWTGSEMLLWPGDLHGGPDGRVPILAYSPERDRWTTLGLIEEPGSVGPPDGPAAWTGQQMMIFFRDRVISLTPH